MARKKYYRSYKAYNEYAIEHVRQYNDLKRRLGPVIEDVKKYFFEFPKEDLDDFLNTYKSIYGKKAESYALDALPLWKSGKRKMAGQTAERLLNLVPKYLSTTQRYDIVKRLCKYHLKKSHRRVSINTKMPHLGFSELKNYIDEFSSISILKHIPEHVMETAKWLNDHDITLSRRILAEVDNEISKEVALYADKEVTRIHELVKNGEIKNSIQTIKFPHGTIVINISTPGSCFVVTASMVDDDSYYIRHLQKYRDNMLFKKKRGVKIIGWYYTYGEKIATFIKDKKFIKLLMRVIIKLVTKFLIIVHPDLS